MSSQDPSTDVPDDYDPDAVEPKWRDHWLEAGTYVYEDTGAPTLRTASYVLAIRRVLSAYRQGGNWP